MGDQFIFGLKLIKVIRLKTERHNYTKRHTDKLATEKAVRQAVGFNSNTDRRQRHSNIVLKTKSWLKENTRY